MTALRDKASEWNKYCVSEIEKRDKMKNSTYTVMDIETKKTFAWTSKEMLQEINRDTSDEWTDYNVGDLFEGWYEWVEGEFYKIVEINN